MRTRRLLALSALGLVFTSCFEPVIRERLFLDFASNGYARITAEVELAGMAAQTNDAVRRRLLEAEQALLTGGDPWTTRFAALEAAAERFSWEKRLGSLHAARRAALVTEPEELARFFDSTDVGASYRLDEELGQAELVLAPRPSSRAGRRERRLVEKGLSQWSGAVAKYLSEVASLYAYLEEHPEEQRTCLGHMYDDLLSPEEKEELPPLAGENDERLDRLGDAMLAVLDALQVPEQQEMSLDELSRLVFDPFPAEVKVSPPAAPEQVEGFVEAADGSLEVPRLSLWAALGRLSGRWISPDPVFTLLELEPRVDGPGGQPIPLAAIVAAPRRFATATELPRADELRDLLEAELSPAPLYRAVWRIDPEAEPPLEWRE